MWEYKIEEFSELYLGLENFLNIHGIHGWELVTVIPENHIDGIYIFKRKIE
jgi:hypothetical protein